MACVTQPCYMAMSVDTAYLKVAEDGDMSNCCRLSQLESHMAKLCLRTLLIFILCKEALRQQQEENCIGREFLLDFFKVDMAQVIFYRITGKAVVDNNYSF